MNAPRLIASYLALSASTWIFGNGFDEASTKTLYQRPAEIPFPEDNPGTEESIDLGKKLFFDPRLSSSGIMSCATCHNPSFSWGDGRALGVGHGHKKLGRRTPTVLNAAWNMSNFWDGRVETLEEQALGPIESAAEMNLPIDSMIQKISSIQGYRDLFRKAYPDEGINPNTVAKALANYQRTIVSTEAPFDRWVNGDDSAISNKAKRGFKIFNTKALCVSCHSGWNFTDGSFHDIGVAGTDKGRGAILGFASMDHTFKTPTLRNSAERAPFMHNGTEANLRDVIELYIQGGREKRATLSSEIHPLDLEDEEIDELIAFLKTLSSPIEPVSLPSLPN